MPSSFLVDAADWFTSVKAPGLKEKVEAGMVMIKKQLPLDDKNRKLFGFFLFSYSMDQGPLSFFPAQVTAAEIGVLAEMVEYAENWINHNKREKAEQKYLS